MVATELADQGSMGSPRNLRFRYRTKLALAFGGCTFALMVLSTALCFKVARDELLREFTHKLLAVAASGAAALDGDAVAAIRSPEQLGSPSYRRLQSQLAALRRANEHIALRYVYTMRPGANATTWIYGVDSEPTTSADFSPPGAVDDEYHAETIKALTGPYSTGIDNSERWGKLLTAAAPIRDAQGRAVGVLAVDATLETVNAALARLRAVAAACLLLALLLPFAASWVVAGLFNRPIFALIAATERVREGEFDQPVELGNRDELGQLADSFNGMLRGLHERELYKVQFERYVSRQVADLILSSPEQPFWQGERRQATILFVDMRNFTALSETLAPDALLRRLNQYLERMIEIIFQYDGTLDKFIGDGIMALFGAPLSTGEDEQRAVLAALALQRAAEELSAQWEADGHPPLRIGVGINSGEVVVGNIGSQRRLEYSALGDTVNVAARLEGLNKVYGTGILASAATVQAVRHEGVQSRFVASVRLRGRVEPVEVHEVVGLREGPAVGEN